MQWLRAKRLNARERSEREAECEAALRAWLLMQMNVNWVTAFKHGKATLFNARQCEGVDAGKLQKQQIDRGGGIRDGRWT
eukprot:3173658-Pleurochrysis_carterae.AAC.1